MRKFLVLILAPLLGACVLQSETPLVSEQQGELALAGLGPAFDSYSLHDSSWDKEDESIMLTAEGQHYVVSDGKDKLTATFKGVDKNVWVMQAEEDGKPSAYIIATRDGSSLLLAPIACSAMKDAASFDALVRFDGDDCFAKPGIDAAALFTAAEQLKLQPTMKLTSKTGG
mgnify:CR=1 FL=1